MRKVLCTVLAVFCLSGCHRQTSSETEPLCHYVVRAEVTCHTGGETVSKQFTADAKIESVLHYLRLLEDNGDVDRLPRNAEGADYEILLFFSDGGCRLYRQKGTGYLSKDGGPWLILKQRQGSRLQTLFKLLPSDG